MTNLANLVVTNILETNKPIEEENHVKLKGYVSFKTLE